MRRGTRADPTRVAWSLALACLVALGGCGSEGPDAPPPPAPDVDGDPQPPDPAASPEAPGDVAAGLVVSFLLDPRITTSVYTGERWVTPEIFTLIHEGDVVPVHARAHMDHRSGRIDVSASWAPADPDMIAVSLEEGHQVEITVRRAGETTLTVTHGESSTTLTVTATQDAGTWRVDISQ